MWNNDGIILIYLYIIYKEIVGDNDDIWIYYGGKPIKKEEKTNKQVLVKIIVMAAFLVNITVTVMLQIEQWFSKQWGIFLE